MQDSNVSTISQETNARPSHQFAAIYPQVFTTLSHAIVTFDDYTLFRLI